MRRPDEPGSPLRELLSLGELRVDVTRGEAEVRLEFRGRSEDRRPELFLSPLLLRALQAADGGRRVVVLDFTALEYMNSSTYTPVVRMLEEAARGPHRVRLEFNALRKWQTLSFAALRAFETLDGRISIHGR